MKIGVYVDPWLSVEGSLSISPKEIVEEKGVKQSTTITIDGWWASNPPSMEVILLSTTGLPQVMWKEEKDGRDKEAAQVEQ